MRDTSSQKSSEIFQNLLLVPKNRQKAGALRFERGENCSGRDPCNLNALSFHSLRRTATTLLHEAGIAGAVAQALIGHDSEAIHEHYVNVGRDALQKAVAVFPSI